MNSLKKQIDSSFEPYEYKRGVDELFVRYKKRKIKIKAFLTSFSAVFAAVIVFFGISSNIFGLDSGDRFSLKVSAITVENPETMISSEKQLVKNSPGVKLQSEKIYYKNGVEITDGKKSAQYFNRAVVVPSPINLKITTEELASLKLKSKGNGSLYNEKYDDINNRSVSFKSGGLVSWIPNCEKLTRSLKADASKFPSTLKNDKLMTEELNSLLKTAEDYNTYFGDTVTITAVHKDKSVETVHVEITLDKNGRYYTSVS